MSLRMLFYAPSEILVRNTNIHWLAFSLFGLHITRILNRISITIITTLLAYSFLTICEIVYDVFIYSNRKYFFNIHIQLYKNITTLFQKYKNFYDGIFILGRNPIHPVKSFRIQDMRKHLAL